jgi:hypothetical protein
MACKILAIADREEGTEENSGGGCLNDRPRKVLKRCLDSVYVLGLGSIIKLVTYVL